MTVGSKAQREALALGRKLVEELGLGDRVDTLGRWMAHHLSELITRSEQARDGKERASATDQAVDVILRIWSHRPNADRVNPLADLKAAVAVLRTLSQDAPRWTFGGSGLSDAARRTYDLLRRLAICLCLFEIGGTETLRRGLSRARRTAAHQSSDELAFAVFVAAWLAVIPDPPSAKARRPAGQHSPKEELTALRNTALGIAEQATTALSELTDRLKNHGKLEQTGGGPLRLRYPGVTPSTSGRTRRGR